MAAVERNSCHFSVFLLYCQWSQSMELYSRGEVGYFRYITVNGVFFLSTLKAKYLTINNNLTYDMIADK